MQDKVQVTVYIPTKDRCQLLQRAVESVLTQSYSNVELLVVDDNSTDETLAYLEKLSKNDKRVRYFTNKETKGACYSRNLAIKNAKGYFVTGLDDDDYFCRDRILQLVEAYDEKYAFVCANISELKENGDLIDRNFGLHSGEFGLEQMLNYNVVGNQVLTTKDNLNEIGGFDNDMPSFQDYDTWVRLLRKTSLAYKIPERNYVLATEHGGIRISSSNDNKVSGLEAFIAKNQDIMSKQQLISMQVMRYKVSGNSFRMIDLIRTIHRQNYKAVINLYIIQKVPWIKQFFDHFKKTTAKVSLHE